MRSNNAQPSPGAVGRFSVREVSNLLRERIAAHRIPPGARLREWDVAAEFDIPRLSAREALEALVHLGFVDRQPNRGIVVRQRALGELLGLLEMREVNEGLCARLAAEKAPRESWDDLIDLFSEPMQDIVERKDLEAYVRHYKEFHRRLIEAADFPHLTELLERLSDMTSIFGRRVLLVSDRTTHGLQDHRAVLKALRQGDALAAEQLRRATIVNVRTTIERYHAFLL